MNHNELQNKSIVAVEKGRKYLISCLENDKFFDQWIGTSIAPPVEHSSSPMLCFFAARALQCSGGISDMTKEKFSEILSNARRGDSYGYDRMAPVDSDDTAFALRTLIILGQTVTSKMISDALSPFTCGKSWFTFHVQNHTDSTPGFHCYFKEPASIFGPHPEVHMNILLLHHEAGLEINSIPGFPEKDGLPVSYFYRSAHYGAWLLSTLYKSMGFKYHQIEDSVFKLQNDDGSWSGMDGGFSTVQETSLAILTLNTFGIKDINSISSSVDFLIGQQTSKGFFPGGSLWHHYLPHSKDNAYWYAKDIMSIASTSLAIIALSNYFGSL